MSDDPVVVRRYPVGMSIEALASAWARQEGAPDGAVVVLGSEVSGRLRGGAPWSVGGVDAVLMGMVVRPDIDPLQEALLWLPASLAAADALSSVADVDPAVLWPDAVIGGSSPTPTCRVNLVVQLGPGRVDHAIFATRVDVRELGMGDSARMDVDAFAAAFVAAARGYVRRIGTDLDALLAQYSARCAHIGERARVEVLPRGEARGRVVAIDQDGFLVLESSTGMLERVAPASLRSIEIVDERPNRPH